MIRCASSGCRKILKKHDKNLPNPCSAFYIGRLHQQGWVRGDYSDIIVNISRIYSLIRGDASKEKPDTSSQNFLRKTTKVGRRVRAESARRCAAFCGAMSWGSPEAGRGRNAPLTARCCSASHSHWQYWVRPEFVTAIKYVVSQQLPVSIFSVAGQEVRSDAQLVNSVYLDNSALELYHGRLDKTPGAIALRLRWYGTGEPTTVFVERKTHRDSWTGEVSVKERFIIKPNEVPLLLTGRFDKDAKIAEMRSKGKSDQEIEDWDVLASEIIQSINSKQLVPTMRSQYMRTAFQMQNDASVRISLDTNLCMIYERDLGVMLGERWYRDPTVAVPADQITRFPHAVLEVKLEILEGMTTPHWVKEMLASGMVCEVFKFSKFIHGCAVLMQDDVQAVPYWVDDPSLELSIEASKGADMLGSARDRLDANRMYPQLLPSGAEATARRKARGIAASADAQAAQSAAAAAARREQEADVSRATGSSQQQGGGGAGAWGNTGSGRPPAATSGPASAAALAFVPPAPIPPGRVGSETSLLTEDEEESRAAYYQQAAVDAGQLCAGTPCWWVGGEALVADDLPTPLQKVEPKSHFANERTMIHWFRMATTVGVLAAGILAFGEGAAEVFGLLLSALSAGLVVYALRTFHRRGEKIRNREQVRWDDPFGPVILGVVLVVGLSAFFVLQLTELGMFAASAR